MDGLRKLYTYGTRDVRLGDLVRDGCAAFTDDAD
jgi:hypothetical protein